MLAEWVSQSLGVPVRLPAGTTAPFGLEFHHDGSGRVDVSQFGTCPPGTLEVPGVALRVAGSRTDEFDLGNGTPVLAGSFQQVIAAGLPPELDPLGRPALAALMAGRGGELRLIYDVGDVTTLLAMVAHLERVGCPAGQLRQAAPLLTEPHSLRLVIEWLPAARQVGGRIGIEVMIDPGVFAAAEPLSQLGVSSQAINRMVELAAGLPRGGPGVGTVRGIGWAHFAVSWPEAASARPVLKSYLFVTEGPSATAAERLASLIDREGIAWPDLLDWAGRQLPLRQPGAVDISPWEAAVRPHRLADRLAAGGMTRDQALVALGARPRTPAPVGWVAPKPTDEPLPAGAAQRVPYAHALWPLAASLGARLPRDLRRALLARLCLVAAPTLDELFWRDAPFGQRLATQLPCDAPPRTRYERFCAELVSDSSAGGGWAGVLGEYPVLGSLLVDAAARWRTATDLMCDRITDDRDLLARELGVPADAAITGYAPGLGDPHNGGQSVCVVSFGEHRVVYKPRSVSLELLYSRAVASLPDLHLRAARTLARGEEYGYMQFIEASPATDLTAFYRNAGAVLAVLHLLGATDSHHENLIASGNQLVLVDGETLFGPADNVLATGMLPHWTWLDARRIALDISALGAPPGAPAGSSAADLSPWRAINTDHMTRQLPTGGAHPTSLPTPPGVPAALAEQLEELTAGFREAYDRLSASAQLPELWRAAAGRKRRVIHRPTYVYAGLLEGGVVPAALRSAVARGMVSERLTRAHIGPHSDPTNWSVVAAEQAALARLDIPYFTEPIAPERGVRVSEADRERQVQLIRASVAAAGIRHGEPDGPGHPIASQPGRDPRERQVAAECLASLAANHSQTGDLTVLSVLPDGVHVNVQPIGAGLYDGRMGVAVALAGTPLAARIGAEVRPELPRLAQVTGIGLAGIGGILRAMTWLGIEVEVPNGLLRGAGSGLDLMSGVAGLIRPLIARGPSEHPTVLAAARILADAQQPDGGWLTLPSSAPLTGLAHGASGIALALAEAGVALGDEEFVAAAVRGCDYEAAVYDPQVGNWPDFRSDPGLRSDLAGEFMMGWCAGAPGIALTRLRMWQLLGAQRWADELELAARAAAQAPLLARDHLCCGNFGRVAILREICAVTKDDTWAPAANGIAAAALDRGLRTMIGTDEPGLFTGLAGIGLALQEPNDWVLSLLL